MSENVKAVEIVVTPKGQAASPSVVSSGHVLQKASVVQLNVARAAIKKMGRTGDDLTVTLSNGDVLVVRGFFQGQGDASQLVLADAAEGLSLVHFQEEAGSLGFTYSHIDSIDPLLMEPGAAVAAEGGTFPLAAGIGAGALGLVAAGAGGGGSGGSGGSAPEEVVPVEPGPSVALRPPVVHLINGTAPVTGMTEPGLTVTVTFPNGESVTVQAGEDGSFSAPNPGLLDGDSVIVSVADEKGNSSATEALVDAMPPEAAVLENAQIVESSPGVITGSAEPGATVLAVFPDGKEISVKAGDDGLFSVSYPALAAGQQIIVTVQDAAGNTSDSVAVSVAGAILPPSPELYLLKAEGPVEGYAGHGATVTVTFPDGTVVTAQADDNDGKFSIPHPEHAPVLEHGAQVAVSITGQSGQATVFEVVADFVAPESPLLDPLTPHGPVTGTCEPGAQVFVVFPGGEVAAGVVSDDGRFSIAHPAGMAPLEEGAEIKAFSSDQANNMSEYVHVVVPGATEPVDPEVVDPVGNVLNDTVADDAFESTAADETFNLFQGGKDSLVYTLLDAEDATGGNGNDQVNGFTLGAWGVDADADQINLAQLLQNYEPSVDAQFAAEYVDGEAVIGMDDLITNYLQVEVVGDNTEIKVDTQGTGENYATVVTLQGVQTDLATLLANHQIALI